MSIFGFLRKNKKEKETVIQDVPSQIMELGVEEAIRKKKIPQEKEAMVHFAGIMILFAFMIFIMFNDIKNVFF